MEFRKVVQKECNWQVKGADWFYQYTDLSQIQKLPNKLPSLLTN